MTSSICRRCTCLATLSFSSSADMLNPLLLGWNTPDFLDSLNHFIRRIYLHCNVLISPPSHRHQLCVQSVVSCNATRFGGSVRNPLRLLQTLPQWHLVSTVVPGKVRWTNVVVTVESASVGLSAPPIGRPKGPVSLKELRLWPSFYYIHYVLIYVNLKMALIYLMPGISNRIVSFANITINWSFWLKS
jgi:hypothetical protein